MNVEVIPGPTAYIPCSAYCDFCKKKTLPNNQLKRCAGCGVVKYCGRDCQKAAWPAHKALCRSAELDAMFHGKFKDMGYTTPLSLAKALLSWGDLQEWTIRQIVDTTVYLNGGLDLLGDELPYAMIFEVAAAPTSPDANPATAFRLVNFSYTHKNDCRRHQAGWEDLRQSYHSVMDAMKGNTSVVGVLSIAMCVEDTAVAVYMKFPFRRIQVRPGGVPDSPDDERTRVALTEWVDMCTSAINKGAVFQDTEVQTLPNMGYMIRREGKKGWSWEQVPLSWPLLRRVLLG